MEAANAAMNRSATAQTIFQGLSALLTVHWVGGKAGAERILWPPVEAGIPFYGLMNWVHPPRLQIFGVEESAFLNSLEPVVQAVLVNQLLGPATGVILVCDNLADQAAILKAGADASGTPLWLTPLSSVAALEQLYHYRHSLEASTVIHGELLEVFGMGVLITGGSGIGKSELALDLISRGHRLIADDTPNLIRVAPDVLEGTCPPTISDLLEVRGLGILNIRRMFGDSAIKRNKRVRLMINLVKQEEESVPSDESRLRGLRDIQVILGVGIPAITLPIAPGRNLAVLLECAVRDHILRLNGYQADEDLMARMARAMAEAVPNMAETGPCA
ncbi:MAG TPA: HPr(Ser) kinase/phosphatase [Candidatus Competibacteraceae bacterium]|nr:HPr(Ser) kinase/phosphatase [Candidatus Competibacteraceae bacterium]HRY19108.1 HPr(Ser) kinase/phosphatase [Candidatus Competibacteraceae bacterium]